MDTIINENGVSYISIDHFVDKYNHLNKLVSFDFKCNNKDMLRGRLLSILTKVTGLSQFIIYAPTSAVYLCINEYLKRYSQTKNSYYIGRAVIYARILVELGVYNVEDFPSFIFDAKAKRRAKNLSPYFSDTDAYSKLFLESEKDIFKVKANIIDISHHHCNAVEKQEYLTLEQEALKLKSKISHRSALNRKDEARLEQVYNQLLDKMHRMENALKTTKEMIDTTLIA